MTNLIEHNKMYRNGRGKCMTKSHFARCFSVANTEGGLKMCFFKSILLFLNILKTEYC